MGYAISARLERLKSPVSGRSLLAALDAYLFSGPVAHLANPERLVADIKVGYLDYRLQGILAFEGFFHASVSSVLPVARIMSATASTERNDPRYKTPIANVSHLIAEGADAIGVHLTIGHPKTPEMLSNTGKLIAEAHSFGFPVLVASYVDGPEGSTEAAVVHASAIARDIGADIVKIMYPGSMGALREAVAAASPAITVLAGGQHDTDEQAYRLAREAATAGAGICFGRSIFEADQPSKVLTQLAHIMHEE